MSKIKYRKKRYNLDTMFPEEATEECPRCHGVMIKDPKLMKFRCLRCWNIRADR